MTNPLSRIRSRTSASPLGEGPAAYRFDEAGIAVNVESSRYSIRSQARARRMQRRVVPGGGRRAAAVLVAAVAPAAVGVLEHAPGDLASPEAEGDRRAERDRPDQGDVRDLDDRRSDPQLVEDHEDRDAHDQQGRRGRGDLARGGVAKGPR